jgi:erythromycin esterase
VSAHHHDPNTTDTSPVRTGPPTTTAGLVLLVAGTLVAGMLVAGALVAGAPAPVVAAGPRTGDIPWPPDAPAVPQVRHQPAADPVTRWAQSASVPLPTVDPAAPTGDLAHLDPSFHRARVVGLGEAVHGAAEVTTLKHRMLRRLVERHGFRTIAWEEDWSVGLRLDRWARTGQGDLDSIVSTMSTAWRTGEVVDVLEWLRTHNRRNPHDQVRFVGTEAYAVQPFLYDEVEQYVAGRSPKDGHTVRRLVAALRPDRETMAEYVWWYWQEVPEKEPFIRQAHELRELVASVAGRDGREADRLMVEHARQIVGFYEQFAQENPFAYRDPHAAGTLHRWQRRTGHDVVYWAASGHTADAPQARLVQAGRPDLEFAAAGSFLRQTYGRHYLSVAVTLDRGTARSDGVEVVLPPAAPDWMERPLAGVTHATFTLDLRRPAPAEVGEWLASPVRTRGTPEGGHDSWLAGGSTGGWFDVLVHRQVVTAARVA